MNTKKISLASILSAIFLIGLSSKALPRIRVMILNGESGGPYHNWQATTPVLKKELDETGLFDVEIVTAPPADGDFSSFKPEWSNYKVIVFNYDAPNERWPSDLKASFDEYMKNGGGLVVVHASDNAFGGWDAFNKMIGVGGWRGRDEKSGPHWFYKDGKLTSDDSPGPAGSHGPREPFQVTVRAEHPITNGLPKVWMHQGDELYANLRGPGENMTILTTSYSDPANKGTGFDEPSLMVISYGKGRVFHSTFGHDVMALSSVDGIVVFQRGVEWAATGESHPEGAGVFSNCEFSCFSCGYCRDGSKLFQRAKSAGHKTTARPRRKWRSNSKRTRQHRWRTTRNRDCSTAVRRSLVVRTSIRPVSICAVH